MGAGGRQSLRKGSEEMEMRANQEPLPSNAVGTNPCVLHRAVCKQLAQFHRTPTETKANLKQ